MPSIKPSFASAHPRSQERRDWHCQREQGEDQRSDPHRVRGTAADEQKYNANRRESAAQKRVAPSEDALPLRQQSPPFFPTTLQAAAYVAKTHDVIAVS
jgi:hypothetical protein